MFDRLREKIHKNLVGSGGGGMGGLLYVRGLKEYLCMYVARDFSRYPLGPPPGPSCSKGG